MNQQSNYWSWWKGGLALALVSTLAIVLVKPIGVSTQYVIADGIIWSLFDGSLIQSQTDEAGKLSYSSDNAYLAKSGGKYAKNIDNPINYSFVFVLSMIGGALLAARTSRKDGTTACRTSQVWRQRFGDHSQGLRMLGAFSGGVLTLYGARLAGGCTSGHMISGMVQTSVSGYLFAAATFATAIPLAIWLYRTKTA